jgi:hypothetical protein
VSTTTLAGSAAYRIEDMVWLVTHWEKSISVYAADNGRLKEVSVLGTQEALDRYSDEIKKMIEFVRF